MNTVEQDYQLALEIAKDIPADSELRRLAKRWWRMYKAWSTSQSISANESAAIERLGAALAEEFPLTAPRMSGQLLGLIAYALAGSPNHVSNDAHP